MAIFNQAFALVLSLPGSAIYHILLFFALQAALGIAISHRRRFGPDSGSTRLVIAAGLAAVARAVLIALVALGAAGLFPVDALLPPLDRALTLFSIVIIAWATMFRPGRRWADVVVSLAIVGIVVLYAAEAIQWYPHGVSGDLPYKYNRYDAWWELAKMGAILFSVLGLFLFRPADWGTALGMFLLLDAGVLIHLTSPDVAQSFPAPERIAEMAAFPLFAVVVYRHALGSPAAAAERPAGPVAVSQSPTLVPTHPSKVQITPEAASALAYIAVGSDDSDFARRVSEAVGRTLLADYTLIFAPPVSEETLSCVSAFDLIREAQLPGFSIASRKISTIASATGRSRPARLRWDVHEQELSNLAEALGIPQYGSAVFVPFAEEGASQNLGGILVMAAFSQKEWTNDDHNLLASIAKPLAKAIVNFNTKSKSTYDLLVEVDRTNKRAEAAEADIQAAQARAASLATELERTRAEARQQLVQIESLTAIIQAETANIQPDTEDLAQEPANAEELSDLQTNYRRALEEMAELNDELAQAQTALQQAQNQPLPKSSSTADAEPAAAGLADASLVTSLTTELAAKQTALEQLRLGLAVQQDNHADEITAFTHRLSEAQREIERLRQPPAAPADASQMVEAQLARAQTEVEQLKAALAVVPVGLAPGIASVDELSQQLADAHSEIVSLRRQLQTAPVDAPSVLRSQSAMLLSLIQDMRQPLSSMMGYTDLLLGESVGIIGALQRNFLERVKASGERMTHTLDDLIRITAIDSGTLMLEEQDFEIVDVIEDAFTGVGTQFREKSISLRMDIADDLPPIAADRDAIVQIISRLLTNACAASEPNSEVTLSAQVQGGSAMVVSVRDTGGGIAEKDMSRVFARSYRADRPLIQGLGETGVGLSIAKALAEAQGGRIWVESQIGTGSTFSVLLPTNGHQ